MWTISLSGYISELYTPKSWHSLALSKNTFQATPPCRKSTLDYSAVCLHIGLSGEIVRYLSRKNPSSSGAEPQSVSLKPTWDNLWEGAPKDPCSDMSLPPSITTGNTGEADVNHMPKHLLEPKFGGHKSNWSIDSCRACDNLLLWNVCPLHSVGGQEVSPLSTISTVPSPGQISIKIHWL